MIKFTSCFGLLFFTFFSFAQIEVTPGVDKDELINTLIGAGVQITDVTINCPEVAYGTFKGNSNIGINDGIILTSGDATLAEGPNNEEGAHLNNFSWVQDDDLQALIPNYEIRDACVIEFGFVPEGDSLSFQYVFGSEEYPEFLEGDFNDVFGFFVSGPGISGKENIALVPGTDMPVSIQTINEGAVKFDMINGVTFTECDPAVDEICANPDYFIFNGNGDNFFNEPWYYDASFIQYNGFTTKLTAGIGNLQPGEEYRIKLAISDAGDGTYDTGVFIAGKSFSTNVPQLTASGIQGEEPFSNAVAGCVNGLFTFAFEEAYTCDVTVNFEIGGSAEAGIDYTSFTNSINIPEGSLKEAFQVEILDDGVAGEAKTIELYITGLSDDTCGSIESDTISLTIEDNPVFAVSENIEIVKGDSAIIEASGGVSYQWSGMFDNPSNSTQIVLPEETTDYEVTIGYGRCSQTLSTRVIVNDAPMPCEWSVSSFNIETCNDSLYTVNFSISGAEQGDTISVSDSEGNAISSVAYNNEAISLNSIPTSQTTLTIVNTTNTDCDSIELNTTDALAECLSPTPCSIVVTMGSISSCTANSYDLQLMLAGDGNGESFTVTTTDGSNLGSYSYNDMPVEITNIQVDQTVLFIMDDTFTDCTTQTVNIFPVVQACINLIPLCTVIEVAPTVTDCTEDDFTLSVMVNSDSTGDFFSITDNLGNDLGAFNYEDVPIAIGPLALDVTVLTITDTGNSECSVQTDDLTAAVEECQAGLAMCSVSVTSAEVTSCNEENYTIQLSVSSTDSGASFSVVDTLGNDLGTYNYADVPVEVSGIAISQNILTIIDNDNADCAISTDDLAEAIEACIDEEPDPPMDCNISTAMATFSTCTEADYSILLAVMGENLGTSFSVTDASGNDLGTYNYADMPVEVSGILVAESILTIIDGDDIDCSATTNDLATEIEACLNPPPSPTCNLTSVMAMVSSCTESDYSAMLNVAGENTGTSFSVTDAAGNDLGTYNYTDTPIEISGIAHTSGIFTITDSDNTDCSASTNDLTAAIQTCLDGLGDMSCSIMAMAMLNTCTENDYTLQLVVSGQNTGDSFTVTNAVGNDLGTYNYADSPILISGVAASDNVFIITDGNDSSCIATTNNISVEIQACIDVITPPGGACNISVSDVSLIACDDTSLSIQVTVNSVNTGNTFKAVTLDGLLVDNFEYSDQPIQIDNISITQNYLYIIDNNDKSCFALINLTELSSSCTNMGEDCTLDISTGFLSLDGDYICDGDSPVINLIDTTVPQGYNTYYVIHNNVNLTPSSLSNTQVYAISNSNFNLDNSLIPCGSPVYITTVIAEGNNLQEVDLTAVCTTFGNTVETIFLCPVSITIEELCNEATGTFILNIVVKGGLPAVQAESEFSISGDIYNGSVGNDELVSITDLPDGSDYTITATDDFGCTSTISGTITCDKELPVELIMFTGEAVDNGNLLKWSTASEIENDFFIIDHSLDGVNYKQLTTIDGSGTITEVKNYEFLDRNAANGTTYYRLSQTDFDGTTIVKGFVFVTRGESIGVHLAGIHPMPFVNELDIQLSSTENIFVRLSLTDLSGRLLLRNEYNLISGLTVISFNTEPFAHGLYLLRIETETGSIVKKVIKH